MTTIEFDGRVFHAPYINEVPPLTDAEYSALSGHIRENGIVVPVVIDEHSTVIDGHHRLRIAAELGIPVANIPFDVRLNLSEQDRFALAYDLNTHRRNMGKDQIAAVILRKRQQGKSLRVIAGEVGASKTEVARLLSGVPFGTPDAPETIVGRDGKQYPARAPRLWECPDCSHRYPIGEECGNCYRPYPIERRHSTALDRIAADAPDLIDEIRAGNMGITDAKRELKEREREEVRVLNRALIADAPPVPANPNQRYQTIVIDPPWDWGDEGDIDQFGRARPTYGTMSIDEIAALPVGDLADENAHIYLWITNRSLPKGFRLLETWGFRYVTTLTWCKPSIGMGNYFRGSTEHVLFGVRGSLPLLRRDMGTHFAAPRNGTHSGKPADFYSIVESCSPGAWLEMFAREPRNGWVSWGAEVTQ